MKFNLSNWIFSLRKKIIKICCFLKTICNPEPNGLTNTSISWYYLKLPGIFRINNYAWLRAVMKRILHLHLAPDTAVSAISAQCLHMILCDIFCIGPHGVKFGNFYLMDHWMCSLCCLWLGLNWIRPDNYRVLGNLVRLLVQDTSELQRGYENLIILISAANSSGNYDLDGYLFVL